VYDLHQLIENPQCREFLESDNFNMMLHIVADDDIRSYRNDNQWLEIHPKEALIFSCLDDLWKDLEAEYNGDFKYLVYGDLPDSAKVRQSLERIKTEIDKLNWVIKLEQDLKKEQKIGPRIGR
jgi:hypothetical protein